MSQQNDEYDIDADALTAVIRETREMLDKMRQEFSKLSRNDPMRQQATIALSEMEKELGLICTAHDHIGVQQQQLNNMAQWGGEQPTQVAPSLFSAQLIQDIRDSVEGKNRNALGTWRLAYMKFPMLRPLLQRVTQVRHALNHGLEVPGPAITLETLSTLSTTALSPVLVTMIGAWLEWSKSASRHNIGFISLSEEEEAIILQSKKLLYLVDSERRVRQLGLLAGREKVLDWVQGASREDLDEFSVELRDITARADDYILLERFAVIGIAVMLGIVDTPDEIDQSIDDFVPYEARGPEDPTPELVRYLGSVEGLFLFEECLKIILPPIRSTLW